MKSIIFVALLSSSMLAQVEKHNFINSNRIELTAVAGSLVADGLTSPWKSNQESNPIAKPFVTSIGGRTAYFGASFAGVIVMNKMLANHPKIRSTVNWSIVAWETKLSIGNFRYNNKVSNCAQQWIVKGIHCQ